MSLDEAQELSGQDNIALISIHEPGQPTGINYAKWKHHCILEFHDADKRTGEVRLVLGGKKQLKFFDKAMAKELLLFIQALPSTVDAIYVHCYGGISRSPAVAKFLGDKVFHTNVHATATYNRYVYSTLEDAWLDIEPVTSLIKE
jgi:predicted protein tyrosine phosphatase